MKEIRNNSINDLEDIREVKHNVSLDYIYEVTKRGVVLLWERISSTFLDRLGNVFCGKDGGAFMGKDS